MPQDRLLTEFDTSSLCSHMSTVALRSEVFFSAHDCFVELSGVLGDCNPELNLWWNVVSLNLLSDSLPRQELSWVGFSKTFGRWTPRCGDLELSLAEDPGCSNSQDRWANPSVTSNFNSHVEPRRSRIVERLFLCLEYPERLFVVDVCASWRREEDEPEQSQMCSVIVS